MSDAITEDWLKSVGFKWHQMDRQPDKHWLLWLGGAIEDRITSFEDLGIELAPRWWKNRNGDDVGEVGSWHCWLRADTAGRYHRFLHVRSLRTAAEVMQLVEALTGQAWDVANHIYGNVYQPKHAESIRRDLTRFDHQIREGNAKWSEVEKDDSRGRALPDHLEAHAATQG
jgi:hypothetical protein